MDYVKLIYRPLVARHHVGHRSVEIARRSHQIGVAFSAHESPYLQGFARNATSSRKVGLGQESCP
jgi:hypothetical protein